MNRRENFLRAAETRDPEWIPCSVSPTAPVWRQYGERLEEIVLTHPLIFPGYKKRESFDYRGHRLKGNLVLDEWGCVWRFLIDGLEGQVIKHPLEDWSKLRSYVAPPRRGMPEEGAPPRPFFPDLIRARLEERLRQGLLASGHVAHGFTFQRLYYLRRFTNLMQDFVTQPPELQELIDMVVDYNMAIINKWLNIGVHLDVISFGDDLGVHDRLPINPNTFRKYLFPAYAKMFGPIRVAGTQVYLHSDGHLLEIAEDLIGAGVTILNPQGWVNGVENIAKMCKGKVCVDLNLDEQGIIPFGTPKQVENMVRKAVATLGSPQGGLMLQTDVNLPTPLENIEALCRAMEDVGGGPKF